MGDEHHPVEKMDAAYDEPRRQRCNKPRFGIMILVTLLITAALAFLRYADLQSETVTFSSVGGSSLVSPLILAYVRATCAALGAFTLGCLVFDNAIEMRPTYLDGSALEPKIIQLGGLARLSTFTVQCWTLLTLYFIGACANSLLLVFGTAHPPRWFLTALWFAYETSLASAALVTFVVTFALIPRSVKSGNKDGIRLFFTWKTQFMHSLNIVLMVIELILNDMPCLPSHIPIGMLWGLYYVLFSWAWLRYSSYSIVYYFFLDPTLPFRQSATFLIVLLTIFAAFFGLAVALDSISLHVRAVLCLVGIVLITHTPLHGIPKPIKSERAQR